MPIKPDKITIIDTTSRVVDVIKPKKDRSNSFQYDNNSPDILDRYKLPLFHWVRDEPDSRDYLYKSIPVRTGTPTRVDLRQFCTSIEDQGSLGSCVGQAVVGAVELLNKRSGRPSDISRLFVYYFSRAYIGTVNEDSGAYIRDGIKVMYNRGAPLEKYWPYIVRRFTQQPTTEAINDGLKRKATRYERVTSLAGCINALTNGLPVIIGFMVYSSFMSSTVVKTGMMPYPNVRRERLLGGHAVLLVGYDNRTRRFIARNSWGTNWGDRGYFYMPYEVISNSAMSGDFWVIRDVSNPV